MGEVIFRLPRGEYKIETFGLNFDLALGKKMFFTDFS